jgi:hypothetical protein
MRSEMAMAGIRLEPTLTFNARSLKNSSPSFALDMG